MKIRMNPQTVRGKFRCSVCKKIHEKDKHNFEYDTHYVLENGTYLCMECFYKESYGIIDSDGTIVKKGEKASWEK